MDVAPARFLLFSVATPAQEPGLGHMCAIDSEMLIHSADERLKIGAVMKQQPSAAPAAVCILTPRVKALPADTFPHVRKWHQSRATCVFAATAQTA